MQDTPPRHSRWLWPGDIEELGTTQTRSRLGAEQEASPSQAPSASSSYGAYVALRLLGRGAYGTCVLAKRAGHREGARAPCAGEAFCVLKTVELPCEVTRVSRAWTTDEQDCHVITRQTEWHIGSAAGEKAAEEPAEEVMREAVLLRSLSHPNVIGYYDAFCTEGRLCIVMEYADGGDLALAIAQRREADRIYLEGEVMAVFAQLVLALKYVHDLQIIHRDLKSQNVFLTISQVVKLGDFGIAKKLSPSENWAMTWVGTPSCVAPEVCDSCPYDFKADVWGLGVVLYELLALECPFKASSLPALVVKICTAEPRPVSPLYSTDTRCLLGRLLSKRPAERPSSTQVLNMPHIARAVAALRPAPAPPPPPLAVLPSWTVAPPTAQLSVQLAAQPTAQLLQPSRPEVAVGACTSGFCGGAGGLGGSRLAALRPAPIEGRRLAASAASAARLPLLVRRGGAKIVRRSSSEFALARAQPARSQPTQPQHPPAAAPPSGLSLEATQRPPPERCVELALRSLIMPPEMSPVAPATPGKSSGLSPAASPFTRILAAALGEKNSPLPLRSRRSPEKNFSFGGTLSAARRAGGACRSPKSSCGSVSDLLSFFLDGSDEFVARGSEPIFVRHSSPGPGESPITSWLEELEHEFGYG